MRDRDMLVPKRRRMAAGDRRRQLVELGTELLVTEPLENLTGQRLAELAGISRGLVFHYFPTVRDLHLACLVEAAQNLVDQMQAAADAVPEGEDGLAVCLQVFVDYITRTPQTFLTMSGFAITDAEFGHAFDLARVQIMQVLLDLVEIDGSRHAIALVAGWTAFAERTVLEWMRQGTDEQDAQVDGQLLEALASTLNHLAEWLVSSGHATADLRVAGSSAAGVAGDTEPTAVPAAGRPGSELA